MNNFQYGMMEKVASSALETLGMLGGAYGGLSAAGAINPEIYRSPLLAPFLMGGGFLGKELGALATPDRGLEHHMTNLGGVAGAIGSFAGAPQIASLINKIPMTPGSGWRSALHHGAMIGLPLAGAALGYGLSGLIGDDDEPSTPRYY